MSFHHLVVLFLSLSVVRSDSEIKQNEQSSCPPWTISKVENGTPTCECGNDLGGVVYCDPNTLEVSVLIYHCMTYSTEAKQVFVGHCFFNYFAESHYSNQTYMHTKVNINKMDNVSQVNFAMCHSFLDTEENERRYLYRTGQMCGSCKEEYAPPVYSYSLACVECKDYKYNWLKYIAVAFLPLTVFYIIVVLFRITVTTGAMNGYVLGCQIAMCPSQVRILNISRGTYSPIVTIFPTVYGIWNLEFFRGAYTPFCLHPKMTTLQALAMDYLVAVYPLVLIVVTYICVQLHNRYSLAVWLWSPFYWCFAKIRKEWDINSSLIGAFATFLLLSYVKILYVSFDLLVNIELKDVNGKRYSKRYLYYDGTYESFGKDHLPYAFLALFMLFTFNIIPLILLSLYPCRWFQSCLNRCWPRREVFRTFAETFHGCFRLRPYDCRYFAAFYLALRISNLFTYAVDPGPAYYPVAGLIFLFSAVIVAIARPYNCLLYTGLDAFFIALIGMGLIGEPFYSAIQTLEPNDLQKVNVALWFIVIPLLYGIMLMFYYLLPKKYVQKFIQCCKRFRQRGDAEDQEEFLSYRTKMYIQGESTPLINNHK